MHDENKGMWCSLCAEHMRKIGHLVSTSFSGKGFPFGLKLFKKNFMLDLVSFLIQICHPGQQMRDLSP
jgi:hypothetical protein